MTRRRPFRRGDRVSPIHFAQIFHRACFHTRSGESLIALSLVKSA
jgi:hypothetical protein